MPSSHNNSKLLIRKSRTLPRRPWKVLRSLAPWRIYKSCSLNRTAKAARKRSEETGSGARSLGLARPFSRVRFAKRGDFLDQNRTDVSRMFTCVGDDDPRPLGRNHNEIRVRHAQTLAAIGADFVRPERNCPVELSNRLNQHDNKV